MLGETRCFYWRSLRFDAQSIWLLSCDCRAQREAQVFWRNQRERVEETLAAIDAGLTPIVCVAECEKENVETVLAEQFARSISMLSRAQFAKIVISYKPIWAIGTGQTAPPEAAAAAHR